MEGNLSTRDGRQENYKKPPRLRGGGERGRYILFRCQPLHVKVDVRRKHSISLSKAGGMSGKHSNRAIVSLAKIVSNRNPYRLLQFRTKTGSVRINLSASSTVSGWANKYPWPKSQPACCSALNCPDVSIPSATASIPRLWARLIMA